MSKFWERVSALFTAAETSSPTEPAVHEMIERDGEFQADYAQWLRKESRHRLFDWLLEEYAVFLGEGQTDAAVSFLDTPSSKGFVIFFHRLNYGQQEIEFFFDYLRQRMLALGYRTQISDRRIFSRRDWVETQERHYLKPRTRHQRETGEIGRGELEQGFGNVMVELELRNDQPWNLRFRATTYQDALYRDAKSFRALMMALTAKDI